MNRYLLGIDVGTSAVKVSGGLVERGLGSDQENHLRPEWKRRNSRCLRQFSVSGAHPDRCEWKATEARNDLDGPKSSGRI